MNVRKAVTHRLWQAIGFNKERPVRFPWAAKDGPPYYLIRRTLGWGGTGFFSNYFYALTHIAYAKSKGWIPVVDMRNYGTLYSENHPVAGTRNAWEYYFQQPIDTRTAYHSGRFVLSDGLNRKIEWHPFRESDESVDVLPDIARRLKELAGDYIQLRPEILTDFKDWERNHFAGKRVLGVHWRGTDKRVPPPGHRPTPPLGALLNAVRSLCERRSPDLVFLASDESGVREALADAVSIPVVTTDAYRLEAGDGRGLHTAHVRHARRDHRYRLGLEVLLDACLLSRCDSLVHGHSNVTNAAMFFRDEPYAERRLVHS
jgi:hypothetical protein